MKKLVIFTLLIVYALQIHSQRVFKKNPSFSAYGGFFDFENQKPALGLGVGFLNGISNHLDYSINLTGTSVKYPYRDKPVPSSEKLLLELDAAVRWKFFSDQSRISPVVSIGTGISLYNSSLGLTVPLGGGLQFNLGNGIFLLANVNYNIPVSHNTTGHFHFMAGICGNLSFRKAIHKSQTPPTPALGFSDIDGDGVLDSVDACPSVPGFAFYKGCPVPDTDGDGIEDSKDKCPTIPGTSSYQGCPIPDSDGDSLNDLDDQCPYESGSVQNKGCPQITLDSLQAGLDAWAELVFFETGKSLLTIAAKRSLDSVVALLIKHPQAQLLIEGHTDNSGHADANKILSQQRAEAVKAYFIKNNINSQRLSAIGFGATTPISSNDTPHGRATNRRVVFRASQ